jgi:hypothetical protein
MDVKELHYSLMAIPLLFVVACAELAGDDGAPNPHCRPPAPPVARKAPAPPPAPQSSTAGSSERVNCGDDAEPQVWDGTGRSEAVRGT